MATPGNPGPQEPDDTRPLPPQDRETWSPEAPDDDWFRATPAEDEVAPTQVWSAPVQEFADEPPAQDTGARAPAPRRRGMTGLVLALLAILVCLGAGGAWYVFGGSTPTTSATVAASTAPATTTEPTAQASTGAPTMPTGTVPATSASSTPSPTTTPTPTPTPSSASPSATASTPAGATVCATGNGSYGHAGTGSSATSCGFATAVRTAYLAGTTQPGSAATVTATSPVTGKSYTMTCSGGTVVRCTGGNDAVVYIW